MSRKLSSLVPVVSLTLALSFLAGCGMTPQQTSAPISGTQLQAVKVEANARKETKRQAEARAKRYIEEFNNTAYRSIRSRTEMVQKIARTDADAAYEFLLKEVDDLQELRGEMNKLTTAEYNEFEEMLLEEVDEMTPDQVEVKKRATKAKALNVDLEEVALMEELATTGEMGAMWGKGARVGSRNRLLTAVQENKVYKAVKKAAKNTRKKVKRFLNNLWKKLGWKRFV